MPETALSLLTFQFVDGDVTQVEYHDLPERYVWRHLPCWNFGYVQTDTPDSFFVEIPPHGELVINDKTLVCVPPNQIHKYTAIAGHKNISTWFLGKYLFDFGIDISEFVDFPFIITPPTSCIVKELIEELLRTQSNKSVSALSKNIIQSRLGFEILENLIPFAKEYRLNELSHSETKRILPVLDYIDKNYARNIDVNHLARLAHLSPTHFNKLFRNVLQLSPMQFVRRTRMNKACEQLLSTTFSVNKIANSVGYEDQNIFSRAFKKMLGSSPLSYRKHHPYLK